MKEIEVEGKTVTIAVEQGLKELGLRRDQVEVQILEQNSAGFLGLMAKPARVRLREKLWSGSATENLSESPMPPGPKSDASAHPKPVPRRPRSNPRTSPEKSRRAPAQEQTAPPPADPAQACETATAVLQEILGLMHLADVHVRCTWDVQQCRVQAEVDTQDSALLTGKDAQALQALQFLTTVLVGRKMKVPVAVQVDSAGHWRNQEAKILSEIQRAAQEVQRTGQPYRFDPMEPALRRLIHRNLAGHPDIETASEGEGPWRKVVLRPRKKAA